MIILEDDIAWPLRFLTQRSLSHLAENSGFDPPPQDGIHLNRQRAGREQRVGVFF